MTFSYVAQGGFHFGGFSYVPDRIVEVLSINQIDLMRFRVVFQSFRVPPVTFSIYLAGQLVGTLPSSSGVAQWDITVAPGTAPFLEIIDDPSGVPHYAASGSLLLNWRQISGAASYEVQQYQNSEWVTLQTFPEKGAGNTLYNTPWLPDNQESQFQVVPVDASASAGTPLSFEVFMVRTPDVPAMTPTINNNRTITFTVA